MLSVKQRGKQIFPQRMQHYVNKLTHIENIHTYIHLLTSQLKKEVDLQIIYHKYFSLPSRSNRDIIRQKL